MNRIEPHTPPLDRATLTILEMADLIQNQLMLELDHLRTGAAGPAPFATDLQQWLLEKRREVERSVALVAATADSNVDFQSTLQSMTRIATEIERIGEYVTTIQTHAAKLDPTHPVGVEDSIISMGKTVRVMLSAVIDAFSMRDAVKARVVRIKDSDVDRSCQNVFARLAEAHHDDTSACCDRLNLIARSIEQIGDHTTQIADSVLLMADDPAPPPGLSQSVYMAT